MPVRTSSRMPNSFIMLSIAPVLLSSPRTASVSVVGDTSMMEARKIFAIWMMRLQFSLLVTAVLIKSSSRRMGFRRIGIATCVGLLTEARTAARIFRKAGFEVYGVACKVGAQPKTAIGIPEHCQAVGKNMCNPILQAKLLNRAKVDLNVVIGLCVGHDSLFYKYAEALTTTLVTKDRVLGHNPAAALYQAEAYYSRLLKD